MKEYFNRSGSYGIETPESSRPTANESIEMNKVTYRKS